MKFLKYLIDLIGGKSYLQLALGAIILIVVLYFNPFVPWSAFRIHESGLQSTAVVLKQIRSTEKLLTASYYGEVYADLEEVYLNMDNAYAKLARAVQSDTVVMTWRDSLALESLRHIFQVDPWEQLQQVPQWRPSQTREYRAATANGFFTGRQKKLILIGRGWVKAGFDLKRWGGDSLRIDATAQSIRLLLPQVNLLHADINPWFDFEKKVKGFEVFITRKDKNLDPAETMAVKRLCKQKLVSEALEKGILAKSVDSGKTGLRNFLSLLGYKKVQFVTTPEELH